METPGVPKNMMRLLVLTFIAGAMSISVISRGESCASRLDGSHGPRSAEDVGGEADASMVAVFEPPGGKPRYPLVLVSVESEASSDRTPSTPARLDRWLRFPGPLDLGLAALATSLAYVGPDRARPAVIGLALVLVYRGLARVVRRFADPNAASAAEAWAEEGGDESSGHVEILALTLDRLNDEAAASPVIAFVARDEFDSTARRLWSAGYAHLPRARGRDLIVPQPRAAFLPALSASRRAVPAEHYVGGSLALAPAPQRSTLPVRIADPGPTPRLTGPAPTLRLVTHTPRLLMTGPKPAESVEVGTASATDGPLVVTEALAPTIPCVSPKLRPRWWRRFGRPFTIVNVSLKVAPFFGALVGTLLGAASLPVPNETVCAAITEPTETSARTRARGTASNVTAREAPRAWLSWANSTASPAPPREPDHSVASGVTGFALSPYASTPSSADRPKASRGPDPGIKVSEGNITKTKIVRLKRTRGFGNPPTVVRRVSTVTRKTTTKIRRPRPARNKSGGR